MKFSLTITDADIMEIGPILDFLRGSSALTTIAPATPGCGSNGPTPAMIAANRAAVIGPNDNLGTNEFTAAPVDEDNAPTNTNAPAVDSAGLPHDPRIHSENKGLNKDQTWRKRRGVEAALITSVEAELRSRIAPQMHQQPAPVMTMPPAQFTPPPMPNASHYSDQPNSQPLPQHPVGVPQFTPQHHPSMVMTMPPQFNPPPMPDAQPPAPVAMDSSAFMQHLTAQMQKRDANGLPLIPMEYLIGLCQKLSAHFGQTVNSITDIFANPNMVNVAVQFITADGRWA